MTDLNQILEAILFVAEEPVTTEELAQVVEEPVSAVHDALEDLATDLSANRGLGQKVVLAEMFKELASS